MTASGANCRFAALQQVRQLLAVHPAMRWERAGTGGPIVAGIAELLERSDTISLGPQARPSEAAHATAAQRTGGP
jgi:hypothetical protein